MKAKWFCILLALGLLVFAFPALAYEGKVDPSTLNKWEVVGQFPMGEGIVLIVANPDEQAEIKLAEVYLVKTERGWLIAIYSYEFNGIEYVFQLGENGYKQVQPKEVKL